jgi:CSLREA domain-containing protein
MRMGVLEIGVERVLRRGVCAAFIAALFATAPAAATTFSPNTTADGNDGACAAVCTLRDAVIAANASAGNDVSMPAGHYVLSLGQLPISQNMTVAGAGARTTTIDAQGTSRVITVPPGITTTIRDLTITGGAATNTSSPFSGEGGAIVNQGTLHLQKSAVVGNSSTFTGGGISAPWKGAFLGGGMTTTIEDSLIANNTVTGGAGGGGGGGLNLFGAATIINSTVTGNNVSLPGSNQGGGIVSSTAFSSSSPGSLTLLNTTIAGNSITGPTPASDRGGGLSGDNFIGFGPLASNLTAKNTIIAGNTISGAAQDCSLVNIVDTVRNISGDATCGFTNPGSMQNTNPQLGPLADNGGSTNTLKPADSSPAKNAADNNSCPGADQRGVSRPQAIICDIGAVELKAPDLQLAQSGTGGQAQASALASAAKKRKQKKLSFLITVTNKGEQSAKGTRLTISLVGKIRKLNLSSGCDISLMTKKTGKKRKAGKRKRRLTTTRVLDCALPDLAPGASTTFTLRLKPRNRQVTSTATVSNQLGESSASGHSATTVLSAKKTKKKHH